MEEPMKKRFTEEQIIRILNEAEQADNIREVCRKHNLTEQTFYRWRNKYGGMDVAEVKRLRELEKENAELKKIVEEQALDIGVLKDLCIEKGVELACYSAQEIKKHATGKGNSGTEEWKTTNWYCLNI